MTEQNRLEQILMVGEKGWVLFHHFTNCDNHQLKQFPIVSIETGLPTPITICRELKNNLQSI